MSEADGNVKSTLKKPLICVEWTAVIPTPSADTGEGETLSPNFYLKSVPYQFKLMIDGDIYLDLVRRDGLAFTEFFRCTVIAVSEMDLELPPPSIRTSVDPQIDYLWEIEISDELVFDKIRGKTISFLVVIEEDRGSTQEEKEEEKSVQTSFPIDPVPCSESLSEDWAQFLDTDTNPDVDFQCDGQSIKAHRSVVSARSPVLAKMLRSQMVEDTTGIVKIEDMDLDTLRLFVRYLYTGRLAGAPTFETAVALYEAADKYQVKGLARGCAQFLIEGLTVENACDVLDVADRHSDDKFVEDIVVFVLEKRVPSKSKHWRAFSRSHPLLANEVMLRYIEESSFASSPPKKRHCANSSTKQR